MHCLQQSPKRVESKVEAGYYDSIERVIVVINKTLKDVMRKERDIELQQNLIKRDGRLRSGYFIVCGYVEHAWERPIPW